MPFLVANPDWTEFAKVIEGTFHYRASAGVSGSRRREGVFASYIEFDCFASSGLTVNIGKELYFFHIVYVDKDFADIYPSSTSDLYGPFYVVKKRQYKDKIHIVAYDPSYVLDVDYSDHLKSIENQFPMTIRNFYYDVTSFAGFSARQAADTEPPDANGTISYFYSPGITVRSVLFWIFQVYGLAVLVEEDYDRYDYGDPGKFKLTFVDFDNGVVHPSGNWYNADDYVISPDNTTHYKEDGVTPAVNVLYKENGLAISEISPLYDGVEILRSDGGMWGYAYASQNPTNIYYIRDNPIVDRYTVNNPNNVASWLLNSIRFFNSSNTYLAAKIELFSFMFPYWIGMPARVYAPDGNYYTLPIMSIDLSDEAAVIESYTTSDVADYMPEVKETAGGMTSAQIIDLIYPVGAIYFSTSATDPGLLFAGTTWTPIEDVFLLTAGQTYTAGDTGGEAEHILDVTEMPSHRHEFGSRAAYSASGSAYGAVGYGSSAATGTYYTNYVGGGLAHNNMPPYLVVYAWERVS